MATTFVKVENDKLYELYRAGLLWGVIGPPDNESYEHVPFLHGYPRYYNAYGYMVED